MPHGKAVKIKDMKQNMDGSNNLSDNISKPDANTINKRKVKRLGISRSLYSANGRGKY